MPSAGDIARSAVRSSDARTHASLRRLTAIICLERFAFGTILGSLALFLISPPSRGGLGWEGGPAVLAVGTATSVMQLAVLVGGWALDRWPSRAHFIGGIGLGATTTAFALAATLAANITLRGSTPPSVALWLGAILVLLMIGNGLFKPTAVLAVSGCDEAVQRSRDAAFTSFWLGIQLGVLFAMIVPGAIGSYTGWSLAFSVTALGPLVAAMLWRRVKVRVTEMEQPAAGPPGASSVRLVIVVCGFNALYSVGLGQLFGLLPVLLETRGERHLLGIIVPTPWIIALETATIVALTPFAAALWRKLAAQGREPSSLSKFALGMVLISAGFLAFAVTDLMFARIPLLVAAAIMIVIGLSEIPLQPIGLSLVSRLSPTALRGRLMGLWYAGSTVGSFMSGLVGAYAAAVGPGGTSVVLAGLFAISATILWGLSKHYVSLMRIG